MDKNTACREYIKKEVDELLKKSNVLPDFETFAANVLEAIADTVKSRTYLEVLTERE